jgi:ABC-type glycerol-3-phosphate transport system substrate-binding protein
MVRTVHFKLLFNILLFFSCCDNRKSDIKEIIYNCTADAIEIKKLKEETEKYGKDNNVKIKLIPFSGEEKLLAMMAADQAPDIFYTNNIIRDKLAAENRILDLRLLSEKDTFINSIRPETIEQGKSIDGGWYHLCNWTYTYAIYFNKSLFDMAHLSYPKSDWSWKEMVEIAKKLTIDKNSDGKIDQWGIYIAPHFISAFERMNHSQYEKNSLFVKIPHESMEVYQMYLDLITKDKVMPAIDRIESMGMQYPQLLKNGTIAMIVEAVPNPNIIEMLDIAWDIAPLPKINDKQPLYFRAYGGGLSISASCKYPKEAWEFLKWLVFKSSIYSPNPMLKNSDFINSYEGKYPILKNSNFKIIWELSERYNGGDYRDFVRYSSWTASTILERMAPVLDNVFRGKETLENYIKLEEMVNEMIVKKIREYLENPSIKKEFRNKIEYELQKKNL